MKESKSARTLPENQARAYQELADDALQSNNFHAAARFCNEAATLYEAAGMTELAENSRQAGAEHRESARRKERPPASPPQPDRQRRRRQPTT